jgi:hypothetical protein
MSKPGEEHNSSVDAVLYILLHCSYIYDDRKCVAAENSQHQWLVVVLHTCTFLVIAQYQDRCINWCCTCNKLRESSDVKVIAGFLLI